MAAWNPGCQAIAMVFWSKGSGSNSLCFGAQKPQRYSDMVEVSKVSRLLGSGRSQDPSLLRPMSACGLGTCGLHNTAVGRKFDPLVADIYKQTPSPEMNACCAAWTATPKMTLR